MPKPPTYDCVPLPASPRPDVFICIFSDKNDYIISAAARKGQLWEGGNVNKMANFLKRDPGHEIQLIDLGANIGIWTLYFAALGRSVLAVEMLGINIHLIQHSLGLSGLGENVTLVHNGMWSEHKTLQASTPIKHKDQSPFTLLKEGEPFDANQENISTICMDDLIPLLQSKKVAIKMDIENAEDDALQCADKFFDKVDVRIMVMEWARMGQRECAIVHAFLKRHPFTLSYEPLKYKPVNLCTDKGRGDVFFVKDMPVT